MTISTTATYSLKDELQKLQKDLFDLTARNALIQVKASKLHNLANSKGRSLKAIYQEAQYLKKEYDLESTLQIHSFLKWKEPQKSIFYTSPLLYKSVVIKLNRKIEVEYEVISEVDEWTVNPTLRHSFSRYFDFELPEITAEPIDLIQSIINALSTENHQIEFVDQLNEDENWQLIQEVSIGNFNYKKSLLGQDYEQIIDAPSAAVSRLFEGAGTEKEKGEVFPILPLDFSQEEAIKLASKNDLVIQGPPGTGKSHTISGLIGHYLNENKKVLFVSQKRSALEVVYDRLNDSGLGHLAAFLNTEKTEKKAFFHDLKSSWEILHDNSPIVTDKKPKDHFPLYDFYLHAYQQQDEKLGCSFKEMIDTLVNSGYSIEDLRITGRVPSLKDWRNQLNFLEEIEQISQKQFGVQTISEAAFTLLNKSVFTEKEPFVMLEKRLAEMEASINEIDAIQKQLDFKSNLKEFTQICLAASILHMVNKTQLDLLNQDSKAYHAFSRMAKKYQLTRSKAQRAEQANKGWANKPSKAEITELIDLLKHRHAPKGIMGILKRRNEKLEAAFKGFNRHLTDIAKQQLLEELRNEWNLKAQLEEIEIKLKHDFNIPDPSKEIEVILQLRNKLNDISQNAYMLLLERDDSFDAIAALSKLHPNIQKLNSQARFIFHGESINHLDEGLWMIKRVRKEIPALKIQLHLLQKYFMLPIEQRDLLNNNACSIHQLNAKVHYHHLVEQSRFFNAYRQLDGPNLKAELDQILQANQERFDQNLELLNQSRKRAIQDIEKLLATPAAKLKGSSKDDKKRLKELKRKLVHEIGKKQRHVPLKQFSNECWELLSEILGVWIMNPLSVSERLDCHPEMFDVVIFDEASQIPLEDAVPAIQRAKQVIVVGDEKQMPPSQFFSSSTEGFTLLDKAQTSFQKVMLKWHYRSEHPDLIQFSNGQFYDHELLTVPPISQEVPIKLHQCYGQFKDRVNVKEAEAIADFVKSSNWKQNEIGIVAFSKDQENQIRTSLKKAKIEHDDILIRNLENVQGIEKDHIIISMAYGNDAEGNFRLNFGPVNQESGSNRLNVLFTRAKKSIQFFTSVSSVDFGLSDNTGVSCLRDYLAYVESLQIQSKAESNIQTFDGRSAVDAHVNYERKAILMVDPSTSVDKTSDLLTTYSVLRNRFKTVELLLTKDEWEQKEMFDSKKKEFQS